jgi:hypothetical protein
MRIFGYLFFLAQFAFFNGTVMQRIPLFKPLDGVQTEKVTLPDG